MNCEGYTASTYGDRIANVYDEIYLPADVSERVDMLAQLAAGGRALELGIGTGTFALPLADGASKYTGLTPRAQWWIGLGPKKAERRCR